VGEAFCGGLCTDTSIDPTNCGSCGTKCGASGICQSGACVCGPATNACNGSCVDVLTDPANCGGCGKVCAGFQFCTNGTCGS
jgi:hypothetical protein